MNEPTVVRAFRHKEQNTTAFLHVPVCRCDHREADEQMVCLWCHGGIPDKTEQKRIARELAAVPSSVPAPPPHEAAAERVKRLMTPVPMTDAERLSDPDYGLAAPPSEPPAHWQPIETAPKDGTLIIVWMRDEAPHRAWQYLNGQLSPNLLALASWTNHNGGGWVSFHPGQPTHWMPLPAPPSERTS